MADKNKIKAVLRELSNSMTRAEAERDFQKEAINQASEEHQIEKKLLRGMARIYHKQNFSEVRTQNEELASQYESIVGND